MVICCLYLAAMKVINHTGLLKIGTTTPIFPGRRVFYFHKSNCIKLLLKIYDQNYVLLVQSTWLIPIKVFCSLFFNVQCLEFQGTSLTTKSYNRESCR